MTHFNKEDWWYIDGWTPDQVLANLNPQVVKHHQDSDCDFTGSLLIKTSKGEKAHELWLDYWRDKDGDYHFGWNQYIFNLNDYNDVFTHDLQESPLLWNLAIRAACDYLCS